MPKKGTVKAVGPYRLAPGFMAILPGAPKALEAPAPGEEAGTYAWSLSTKSATYYVSSSALTEEELADPVDQVLATFVASRADDAHGRVLEQNDLVQQGWPGIEAKMRAASGANTWGRYFLRERRSYIVIASVRTATFPAETTAVMNSLRFTGTPGGLKKMGPLFAPYRFPESNVSVDLAGSAEVQHLAEDPDAGLAELAASAFGNRHYALGYREAAGALATESIDEVPEYVEPPSGDEPRHKGHEVARRTYTLAGQSVTSVEFVSEDGKTYGRTDVLRQGDRIYFFIATVPVALKRSPELDTFFKSIRTGSLLGDDSRL